MAGFQFIHVEGYARKAGKGKASGRTIRDVIAEAKREIGNHHHITNPEVPQVLFGDLDDAEADAVAWADNSKNARGHKLREDGLALLAGVISYPNADAMVASVAENRVFGVEIQANATAVASHKRKWEKFRDASMMFLREKYGDSLKCIVEHTDEKHPHLHFYVVPKIGQSFDSIHEGKAAKNQARLVGGRREQTIAYIEAMRGFQDDFYNKVGISAGLARLGPGKRRLSRAEWKLEQHQANLLQAVENKAHIYKKDAKAKGFASGKKAGYIDGKAEGLASSSGAGTKVGAFFGAVKNEMSKVNKKKKEEESKRIDDAVAKVRKAEKQKHERDAEKIANQKGYIERLETYNAKKDSTIQRLEDANARLTSDLDVANRLLVKNGLLPNKPALNNSKPHLK